ncbi:hypothetical protein GCM10010430_70690 [Kitasatospora cystarginea]|uniref:DUF317 domain-containing protein n=2 Tax=Kitasatospora cystarginea TaxID=58350 RepID=A0ABP5RVU6_9ACTN
MVVYPGYLAGPGGRHTEFDALWAFTKGREDWSLSADDGLVAEHESGAAGIELDLDEEPWDKQRWKIFTTDVTNYSRAAFDARTPAEVVMASARHLAHLLDQPTDAERAQQLWSHDAHADTTEALRAEATRANWSPCCPHGCVFTAPTGTASLHLRNTDNDPVPGRVAYVLRAGAPGREEDWWTAEFSLTVPTSVILAALRTVTDPGRYTRRASQIPMAHRAFLRTHPVARRGSEAARGR